MIQKKVSCSEGPGGGEEGQGRQLAKEGWGGFFAKAWVEWSGSSGALLSGTPKYLLCGRVPGFAPTPPSPSAMLMAEAEKIGTYSPFLTGEENLSSGFCGEGSTLCS